MKQNSFEDFPSLFNSKSSEKYDGEVLNYLFFNYMKIIKNRKLSKFKFLG